MNKVNLCWVFSEGRQGHEIQSVTLASHIANHTVVHHFTLRQPWLSLAPRIIPGFQVGIDWLQNEKPKFTPPPEIIITTGRKAAAVGKFVTQKFKYKGVAVKHIQILNPKDSPNNYDLLLLPEHDQKSGSNIINFSGSIHPYDQHWFERQHPKHVSPDILCAVILGNPPKEYFKKSLQLDFEKIRQTYKDQPLWICGSPRLSKPHIRQIEKLLYSGDQFWFSQEDGNNPYQNILHCAKHIFVTADSINMMNECAASPAQVTLLAAEMMLSPKHKRFIHSAQHRWTGFEPNNSHPTQITYAVEQIIRDQKLQKLLNSPSSFNSG